MACLYKCCSWFFSGLPTSPPANVPGKSSQARIGNSYSPSSQYSRTVPPLPAPPSTKALSPDPAHVSFLEPEQQPSPILEIIQPLSPNENPDGSPAQTADKVAQLAGSLPGNPLPDTARLKIPSPFSLVKVLVIDKDQRDLHKMKRILLNLGVPLDNITLADNVPRATQLFPEAEGNSPHRFNIVFMDMDVLAIQTLYPQFKTFPLIALVPKGATTPSSFTGLSFQASTPKPLHSRNIEKLLREHAVPNAPTESWSC